jgi:hypothetical protein
MEYPSKSTLRRLVHGRVDRADHRLLKHEADARGISMTKCVGDILREYFALRKEMLSVLGRLDRRRIAALAGLAPFARDSGAFRGRRMITGGRAHIRRVLYMATLTAIKYNPAIACFISAWSPPGGRARSLSPPPCASSSPSSTRCSAIVAHGNPLDSQDSRSADSRPAAAELVNGAARSS